MKLPNAPLAEVIFELRWALEGDPESPVQFRHDPVYPLLASEFTEKAGSHGYGIRSELSSGPTGPLGHRVQFRFSQSEDSLFPLWQIGPGLFACNESTDYEWKEFKANLRNGLEVLLSSYPKSKAYPMRPVHLELRYIDGFDSELLGHADFVKFLGGDVEFNLEPNDFLKSKNFSGHTKGSMEIIRTLTGDKESLFSVEIATVSQTSPAAIRVTSKVMKRSNLIELGNNNRSIISNVMKWADSAHDLTHEFFQDFVQDSLMNKFIERG